MKDNLSLKEVLKAIINEDDLAETSTAADAGFYNIPAAFRGNSSEGKAKQKKNATQAGYEVVKGKEDTADKMGDPEERIVSYGEGTKKKPVVEITEGYADFKASEGHPRQKIGRAIQEINRQINEINRVVRMSARLKKESNLDSGAMWKSTTESLNMLESKLNVLANRIRELKS